MLAWLLSNTVGERPAVWDAGRWHSYAELTARVRLISACVRDRARLGRAASRPIVPILGEPSFHQIAAYLGVVGAGAIPAMMPPMADEALAAALAQIDAGLAFADPAMVERARSHGAAGALPSDVALSAEQHAPRESPEALALLHYTSGSTGAPRGVALGARGIRFNTNAILAAAPLAPGDRALLTMPIYYCYGLSVLHTHLVAGAAVALSGPGFSGTVLQRVEETSATGLPGVPSLFAALVNGAGLASLASLRYVMVSGGKLRDGDLRAIIAAAPHTTVHVRYGITETTAAASFLPADRLHDKLGSIGRGLAGAPLLLQREDGSLVLPGETDRGEILVRGEHVALGYFRDPVESEAQFVDGSYRTGDLARVDADGFFYIEGRKKAFVKTGGHRVTVEEVEDILLRDEGVMEAAVLGVPDAVRGEALVAVVVVRPGHELTPAQLRARCARALPAFKVPVRFHFAGELPRTSSGKLDRKQLATLALPDGADRPYADGKSSTSSDPEQGGT